MKLLLYCTKSMPYLYFENDLGEDEYGMIYEPQWLLTTDSCFDKDYVVNGKIVAECDFEVEEIETLHNSFMTLMHTETLSEKNLLKNSCLTFDELDNYLKKESGYAIHIKNLKVFDKPKELRDFEKIVEVYAFESERCSFCTKDTCYNCRCFYQLVDLEKAPKNMMYVFDGEEKKVLIPTHPEQLCKIFNGECTVIVKKKVLKEMVKNE